jgi:hypothetical protein
MPVLALVRRARPGGGTSLRIEPDSTRNPGALPIRGALIQTRVGGHFRQDGKAVQRFAIRKTVELFEDAKKGGAPDYFIGHQGKWSNARNHLRER